jgi:uncharacterized protein (TIGR03663 family)
MKLSRAAIWIFPAIVVLAAALRFPGLNLRPMHADEAVHAAKMGQLLEQGRYEYDPVEFHGPTLNYLTLVPAWLRGTARYQDLDEFTLRSVPAAIGVLLVGAHLLLIPVIGFRAAAVSALLTAVSPALVYYSRYYIQETLLVGFSFGALVSICRYVLRPCTRWALSAGACVGLMFATKETWVIAVAAMAAAFGLAVAFDRSRGTDQDGGSTRWAGRHLLAAILAATAVSGLFFSSFLSHPGGVIDSVIAYPTYVGRATASTTWHIHPWHYYLDLLLYFREGGGPVWTEAVILVLALVGVAAALARKSVPGVDRRLLGFLGFYAVLMVIAYALIPYKTPWCLLGFLHGLVLLAGVGAVNLFDVSRSALARGLVVAFLVAAVAHLGWQAWAGSFRFEADPRNPYVYAHTSRDVFEIVRRVERLALAHPQRLSMPIDIVSRENLWPLPWYFRRFSGIRWESGTAGGTGNAPVILTTPESEGAVVRTLYELRPPGERELYMNIFDARVELRPQVEVRGYASKSLWDEYRQSAR